MLKRLHHAPFLKELQPFFDVFNSPFFMVKNHPLRSCNSPGFLLCFWRWTLQLSYRKIMGQKSAIWQWVMAPWYPCSSHQVIAGIYGCSSHYSNVSYRYWSISEFYHQIIEPSHNCLVVYQNPFEKMMEWLRPLGWMEIPNWFEKIYHPFMFQSPPTS